MPTRPVRAYLAEALGTALLLWAIVGSGMSAATTGSRFVQLGPHALFVGLALTGLILTLGPISGAHLNPAVTLAAVLARRLPLRHAPGYVTMQLVGAGIGTMLANAAFGVPVILVATRVRAGTDLLASELIVTLGLVLLILLMVRAHARNISIASAVGAYIALGIVLSPSTAFANPAVTLARTLSDTFTGIAPRSVPGFVAAQLVGAGLAIIVLRTRPGDRNPAAASQARPG
jgi:glycerol uptake facilitator-like aquaporin